jgi:hypothetical protein
MYMGEACHSCVHIIPVNMDAVRGSLESAVNVPLFSACLQVGDPNNYLLAQGFGGSGNGVQRNGDILRIEQAIKLRAAGM